MPRIRTIKPEFPQSESIGRLSRDARLLFIQLWTLVDDEGRTRASSRMLASLLYPYDDDARELMETWIKELETQEHVRRYQAEGHLFLEVLNFNKHQKIDHPSVSKLPPFKESSRILANPLETLAKTSVGSGREGKGREGKGSGEDQNPSPNPRKRVSEGGSKKHSDPRYGPSKDLIFAYYQERNDGADPDWEGREGKALGMLLRANPKLTQEGIRRLLEHRGLSEVNHSDRPGKWLGSLTSFRNRPLDRFGKPMNGANGNGKSYRNGKDYDRLFRELGLEEEGDRAGAGEHGDHASGGDGHAHDQPVR